MNLISQYVLRVGAYMIFAMLLEGIIPAGSSKKIVKLMISLMFMYVLIQPVVSWLQQEIPLAQLTTKEFAWDGAEAAGIGAEYEKQALAMVGKGYESVLQEQGLPKDLEDQYQILQVRVGDTIELVLARNDEVGGLTDRSLKLGQIGSSSEEEAEIRESLSDHWGIPQENLEMRLR